MNNVIIRMDYDGNVSEVQINKWVSYASEIMGIKIKKITIFPSRNGGKHVYVFADKASDIQIFLFKYYANEDRKRINAEIRRWKYNYPKDYSYLFYAYIKKPKSFDVLPSDFEFWDYLLAITVRYYPLYVGNAFPP
jgi:hypothetical protein